VAALSHTKSETDAKKIQILWEREREVGVDE
jgi:hypothetical protein